MDGASLVYKLRGLIQEDSGSAFLDTRTSYDYLYEAAKEFSRRTNALTATQSITTVASQDDYDLNPDFMNLYFRNDRNELVIKYTTAAGVEYWLKFRPYDAFKQGATTTAVDVPSFFTITDKQAGETNITGTATATGSLSSEESTLTDASSPPFATVAAGDTVHNTTDGSSGIVTSATSSSALQTVLFGGTNNYWTSGDAYIIVPQTRKQILLDPPPSGAGDTLTIEHIQTPAPVYSSYRSYRIDSQYEMALVSFAAFLYKYRDRQPNAGDRLYSLWDAACRKAAVITGKSLGRKSFRVNMMKRSYGDRSYR